MSDARRAPLGLWQLKERILSPQASTIPFVPSAMDTASSREHCVRLRRRRLRIAWSLNAARPSDLVVCLWSAQRGIDALNSAHCRSRPWTALLGLISLLVGGTAHAGDPETSSMKTVEGSIWYRERMGLPPNAEILVTLENLARADAPSDVIATIRLVPEGGPPFPFSLAYDPGTLHKKGRYALRARIEAGGRLLFTSTEHIPAFGQEPGPVEILVSRVGGARIGGDSQAAKPDASLTNTYWKLVEMGGQPAALGAGQRELHLVLGSQGARVQGFSGCNRFTGSYERSGDQLRLGQLASTRMACVDGMEQEHRFLDALAKTTRFELGGENLALYADNGQPILRFQAVYLK